MQRRTFLASTALSMSLPTLAISSAPAELRVAVIGHTGRGNYGHGLDTVWLSVPDTKIVAVADANPAGLARAKQRLKVEQGFADYAEMLQATQPDLVAIAPRQPDQHRDMVLAAVAAGAKGIYMEKPFCRTPAEADQIIAACEQENVKLAVAHRNRYHPTLTVIDDLLEAGKLGKVLELRGRGKGDRRGGGEDLWVLGSHVLNLMDFFGGQPKSCSAVLLQDGRRVTAADVHPGNEALGPLAGNQVHARYLLSRGMVGYFDSVAHDGTHNQGFGLQIIGSQGVIDIKADGNPLAYFMEGNPLEPIAAGRPWVPITSAGIGKAETHPKVIERVQHHQLPVIDLVDAVKADRQPLCNMHEAATTVEMICGVFESHRQGSRAVELPLEQRGNALEQL